MTAQGSRRVALVLALAALALVAWRLWPDVGVGRPATGTSANAQASYRSARSALREDGGESTRAVGLPTGWTRNEELPAACIGWEERRTRKILSALEPEHSAEDALAHGLLARLLMNDDGRDPDARRHERSRMQAEWQGARRRWPADLDIAWQAARNCAPEYGCDEEDAQRHLLELDRDNAAAWFVAMAGARRRGQFALYDADLASAARTTRYARRTGSVFRALQPLFAAMPPPGACIRSYSVERRAAMLGRLPTAEDWANEMASLLDIAFDDTDDGEAFEGCRSTFGIPVPERRRGDCVVVLSMLANGTTFSERETALPLLILLLGESADGMAYREDYRRTLYLESIAPYSGNSTRGATDLMNTGDVEFRRQVAIAQHRWPPPADWMPRWSVHQALILGGEAMPPTLEE